MKHWCQAGNHLMLQVKTSSLPSVKPQVAFHCQQQQQLESSQGLGTHVVNKLAMEGGTGVGVPGLAAGA
ncbi:hypothetical protein HaLaN_13185 [Haematococcus lacustris]|uniref:Uncharacterized protein n=1 Tax=Haematococcus lacustris TaxID=44745 RepID=A0A699ZCI0_HAELA|nr:hypothetical protein HaLaN_13185 [Haematococcus lacustris]